MELAEKLEQLQETVKAEKQQVSDKIAAMQAEIVELKQMADAGKLSTEELKESLAKIEEISKEVAGIVE